jgi:pyruvate dehydrogenase E1 component
VPIIPDEARTFGMDAMFPTAKIYSPHGQNYDAVDRDLFLSYKEAENGQILHEGINEAGSMASVMAAATSYATHGEPMIPVYVFYSMFGFQRTGDQMWALADQLGRGFLIGATAGRTTLNGEGLQHEDGHSLLLASTNPACVSYDPAFAFEVATIVKDGLTRMYGIPTGPRSTAIGTGPSGQRTSNPTLGDEVYYYITVYNEPFPQPPAPTDIPLDELERGIIAGLYRYRTAPQVTAHPDTARGQEAPKAQILVSGTAIQWALRAQELLASEWGVAADVWSAPSWTELRREAMACDEHNLLHPSDQPQVPYVTRALQPHPGPVVAVSDWMRAVPDQISRWVPQGMVTLGTDGFGRSDTRAALRRHFHVDAPSIVVAVLAELAHRGEVKREVVSAAIERYQLLVDGVVDTASANEADDHPVGG